MPTLSLLKNSRKIIVGFLSLIIGVFAYKTVFAGCSDIQDLDDRAKCYENKIDDKKEEYESISKKLEDIRNKKNNISKSISGYLSELNVTQDQIDELQTQINDIKSELESINENLTDRKGKLSEKTSFRNKIIRNYSKRSLTSDLEVFFTYNPFSTGLNGFQYDVFSYKLNKVLSDDALKFIYLLSSEIENFEKDKQETESIKNELVGTQSELLSLKADIDRKKAAAEAEANSLKEKETDYSEELFDLEKEIDELSSKQQEILNQKSGSGTGSVGEYEATKVSTPGCPFDNCFAAFSYGAYTHYKGMSQYGAQGRAESGQSYKDILKFYYKVGIQEKDTDEICVEGQGKMDFQEYLYGIAEMPSSWDEEALKAQAVAARSYAYRYAKDGKCICTSQSCQVFLKSKSDNPPSRWKNAVDDTEGEILEGSVVAYYSSTTGGYIESIGWDTKCKSASCWPEDAYEQKAGSPWFRKAWYTKSYSDNNNCGRAHPWLDEEEMADIVNSWRVWSKGSSSEKGHISPRTTSCWGGDPYSLDEMREVAAKYGTAYSKVSKVTVDIGSNGLTSKVKLQTDKGTVEIDGQTFKSVFNLRAPSYIAIRSRLFDFENK